MISTEATSLQTPPQDDGPSPTDIPWRCPLCPHQNPFFQERTIPSPRPDDPHADCFPLDSGALQGVPEFFNISWEYQRCHPLSLDPTPDPPGAPPDQTSVSWRPGPGWGDEASPGSNRTLKGGSVVLQSVPAEVKKRICRFSLKLISGCDACPSSQAQVGLLCSRSALHMSIRLIPLSSLAGAPGTPGCPHATRRPQRLLTRLTDTRRRGSLSAPGELGVKLVCRRPPPPFQWVTPPDP